MPLMFFWVCATDAKTIIRVRKIVQVPLIFIHVVFGESHGFWELIYGNPSQRYMEDTGFIMDRP
jgi:hypothetical protein